MTSRLTSATRPGAPVPPVFVVVAHNDDWQLFMGRDVARHIADPDARVVIVQVTAGDAGRSDWFWKARQQGAIASVMRATAGWSPVDLPSVTPQSAHAVHDIEIAEPAYFPAAALPSSYAVRHEAAAVHERTVLRCTVEGTNAARTAMYFLHLPDGAVGGTGFAANGFASLARLAAGECPDGLRAKWAPPGLEPAAYADFGAVIDTLAAIVREELHPGTDLHDVWMHTMVEAPAAEDHSDHALTSRAVSEMNRRSFGNGLRVARCHGYMTQRWPTERNDLQRAVLAAYAGGFTAAAGGVHGWSAVWEKEFAWWGDREYWDSPSGPATTSPCRDGESVTGAHPLP